MKDVETISTNAGFLRLNQVLQIIPVGRSTFWARVKNGTYPKPVKLGPRTTAWRCEDITVLVERLGCDKPTAESN